MNHIREEHRLLLSPSFTHHDSFTALWEQIAKKHHFIKLTFSHSPTRGEVDEALAHQDGSLSPYSTRLFQEYEIIYHHKGTVILTNQLAFSSLGTFFATADMDSPHRYFVGFAFRVAPQTESITGLLVYFNEQGICDADRTIVCHRVLVTYDQRNGLLRSGQVFLYHQTLVFTQIHRDTHCLMLHLAYLPYDTDTIQECVFYPTTVKLPSEALFREMITPAHRFLSIPVKDGSIRIFDLGSLCLSEEQCVYDDGCPYTKLYFVLDSYLLYKEEQVDNFLEVAHLFPEREYSDGYPLFCIHCHISVISASYSYKLYPAMTTSCGLGSGYCSSCQIRYSKRRERWICAKIRLDGSPCQSELMGEDPIECIASHLHSSDQTVLSLHDSISYKYPYRKSIRFQWFPSEEALSCARSALILDETDEPVYQLRKNGVEDHDDDLFKDEPETL